ncbi:unnamed protein product [Adineta ricciae]|uniref:Protein SMG9 n=1 Tax=Adineta ricciae TaxID=249248 RepID=A0A814ECV3_ADIRI|nr:unnamed protein product [Adineta ricciae]
MLPLDFEIIISCFDWFSSFDENKIPHTIKANQQSSSHVAYLPVVCLYFAKKQTTKQKYNKNNDQQRHQYAQQQQQSTPKQEFKPVAILKRGDPSGTTVINKDESQSKENISTNGQTTKPATYRLARQQPSPQPTVPIILSSTKPQSNVSPQVGSPSTSALAAPVVPASTLTVLATPSSTSTSTPTPTPVVHHPTGPINLISSTSTFAPPPLTQLQQDQHIQSINSRLFSSTATMKSSLKLVDDSLTWCENGQLNNYLQDSDGFVVVGAIGREKVGKSTLLSLLGGNQFIDEDRLMIFPAASSNSDKTTHGIDVYITNEQTILLDTQPLLSSQLHQQQLLQSSNDYHRSQQQQSSAAAIPHFWQQQTDPRTMFIDNILELQTLEIIAFILAVCHVVLIVEDQFADPYLYRLLQLAEILRPVLKRNSNEIIRTHSPHIVFILNKCNNYISPQERLLIKRSLVQMMMDTHFRIYSSLKQTSKIKIQTNLKHIVSDFKQQELNENLLVKLLQQAKVNEDFDEVDKEIDLSNDPDDDSDEKQINYDHVNTIFIPRRDFRDSHSSHWQSRFLGFSNADSIVRQLRQQLLAIDRPHIEQCQTQRAWLTHASRIWDMITKSSQLADFSRLLT